MVHRKGAQALALAMLCLALKPGEPFSLQLPKTIMQPLSRHAAPEEPEPTQPVTPTLEQPLARDRLAYVLLASTHMDDWLSSILQDISMNLQPWTPGDLLVFHSGDVNAADEAAITQLAPLAQVHRIPEQYWQLPAVLNPEDLPHWHTAKGIGYRHMCRWYSIGVFSYLAQLGYEWVLRLDQDSRVPNPVRYDMLLFMEQRNKMYGFRTVNGDSAQTIYGLPELTAWHIQAHKLTTTWLYESCTPKDISGLTTKSWNRRIIYNNMFLTNIQWWLSQPVQKYLSTLDGTNGFYEYRWGDAPVHTMVARTFLSHDQVHCFDWEYCHKNRCWREGEGVYNKRGTW